MGRFSCGLQLSSSRWLHLLQPFHNSWITLVLLFPERRSSRWTDVPLRGQETEKHCSAAQMLASGTVPTAPSSSCSRTPLLCCASREEHCSKGQTGSIHKEKQWLKQHWRTLLFQLIYCGRPEAASYNIAWAFSRRTKLKLAREIPQKL